MTRSGRDASRQAQAITPAARNRPAAQPQAPGFDTQLALRVVGLAILGNLLRSRRLYERLAVAAVVVAALRGIGQENRATAFARLAAWNKREVQRLELKAKHETRAVEGAVQMARSGAARDWAKAAHQT